MGGKVGLRYKGKTLLTMLSNVLPTKIKTKNSNVHNSLKVMEWNPGYLLFFFYFTKAKHKAVKNCQTDFLLKYEVFY